MRRFASVFSSKRDKQSSAGNDNSQLKRAQTLNTRALPNEPAISSASSSSGSASLYLQTPDDDQHHIAIVAQQRSSSKKSWKSWLKVATLKHPPKHWDKPVSDWAPPPNPQSNDFDEEDESESDEVTEDDDSPTTMTPYAPSPARARINFLTLVKNGLNPPPPPPTPFSHRSDASLFFPRSTNPPRFPQPNNSLAATMLKTRLLRKLEAAADRSLTHPEQLSIASLASRQISPTTPVNISPLSYDDPALPSTTLVSLSSRGLRRWISRPCFEDRFAIFIPADDGILCQRVTGGSLAVAALEYSEAIDAMVDFDVDDPTPLPPPATALVIDVSSKPVDLPAVVLSPTHSSSSNHTRGSPYIAAPSPLRNEHSPSTTTPTALSQSAIPDTASETPAIPAERPVKRAVRFQEDDKDDIIPIGYALRMKKKKEEKAKFLQAENERRALMEERAKIEEERRRRDAERAEWERERKAWEGEKKAMEEERRQRMYAEEVAAARLRRESQRAGGVPSSNAGAGAGFLATSTSATSFERNRPSTLRESRRHSRPVYDATPPSPLAPPLIPRREASEPNLPAVIRTNNNTLNVRSSPYSTSPESSRPPSIGGGQSSPIASGSGSGTRPPSVHSSQEVSSSEDVRQQRAAVAAAAMLNSKKRHSTSSYRSPAGDHTTYPMWSGSNQNLAMVPPVPSMPNMMMHGWSSNQNLGMPSSLPSMPVMMPGYVMMDMPLLPPTPPFMLQQYPRQQGQGSSAQSSSSSRGRVSSSVNSSRERVNIQQNPHARTTSSTHRPEYRHASTAPADGLVSGSSSGTGAHRSGHSRGGSTDARRASMPVPQSTPQFQRPRQYSDRPLAPESQPSSMSRGTSSKQLHNYQQQQSQSSNPWTGVPTQSGKLPSAMLISKQSSLSNVRKSGGRGQTIVS